MPPLDTNALKARVAIALSEAKREILHLERSLSVIDAVTHSAPLQRLERDLLAVTPRLIGFLKDSRNGQHVASRNIPKPREVISLSSRVRRPS